VDAVEIDPAILDLGALHPERPYQDPRVTTHVDDARAFLARTDGRYDFVVFGLLDSHILMSSRSNVRLDSFVFTAESFSLARSHLKPGGILVVSHAVGQPWFVDRMRATLAAAFGRPPVVVSDHVFHPLGFVYAAGETLPAGKPLAPDSTVLTDDWPFVYLRTRSVPSEYLWAMLLVVLISAAGVRAAAGPRMRGVDLHFLALGAGFLLIETRGLTALAVIAGSTWAVTTSVFAGVLVMSLLATVLAARLRAAWVPWVFFGILGLALVLNFALPVSALASLALPVRVLLGAALVSLPLFGSGVVFATSLARTGRADRALASNLLGALVGGIAEYASMMTGFRYLLLLAVGFYVLALVTMMRKATRC
jgi:hypothetical protein